MNKKTWKLLGGVLIVLVLIGAVGIYAAAAQAPTPGSTPDLQGGPPGGMPGPRRLGPAEVQAAATALGVTTDDLSAQLESGKTLSDLATEKGVDIQTVQDAIQAAHKEDMRTQINQAVTDGKMTQDKADWLLEGLDKGYLDGPGFGFGFGPGGPGGSPPNQNPAATPQAQPQQ